VAAEEEEATADLEAILVVAITEEEEEDLEAIEAEVAEEEDSVDMEEEEEVMDTVEEEEEMDKEEQEAVEETIDQDQEAEIIMNITVSIMNIMNTTRESIMTRKEETTETTEIASLHMRRDHKLKVAKEKLNKPKSER